MKSMWKKLSVMVFFMLVSLAFAPTVHAANPTSVALVPGRVYTQYDITGDGKADRILVTAYQEGSGNYQYYGIKISVNGKSYCNKNVSTIVGSEMQAALYTLKNGRPLLNVKVIRENDVCVSNSVYAYYGGKIKVARDLNKLFKGYGSGLKTTISVSGNYLKIRYEYYSYLLGATRQTYTYSYSKGYIDRTAKSTYLYVKKLNDDFIKANRLVTNKKISVYAKTTSTSASFTIPAGKTVTVDKVYRNGSVLRYHVKYGSKSGWIKPLKSYPGTLAFKGLFFAG